MQDIAEAIVRDADKPEKATSRARQLQTMDELTPILFGAAAFQQLNAACELGLFELLQDRPRLRKQQIGQALGLNQRALDILLLGTTALGLTVRKNAVYQNSRVITQMFENGSFAVFKDVVAFEQYIVYEGQVDYVESLRKDSNVGLRRVPGLGRDLYHRLSENPKLEQVFYRYMRSWSELANALLLEHVDLHGVRRLLDVGGGDGVNAIAFAKSHPELQVTILEIPGTALIAKRHIEQANLSAQVTVHAGDMFADDYPSGHDAILFAHQLVIWTPEENIALLKRAYQALAEGGKVIIFSSMSNDAGDGPIMAALDSVYFAAVPAQGGMIYAWSQYEAWLEAAGFKRVQRIDCADWTPHGILIATK